MTDKMAIEKAKKALRIADEFCGKHTAEECPDSVHIPIREALAAIEEEKPAEDVRFTALIEKVEEKLKDYCFDAWTFNDEQKQYMGEWDSDSAKIILADAFRFFAETYHAEQCKKCKYVKPKEVPPKCTDILKKCNARSGRLCLNSLLC